MRRLSVGPAKFDYKLQAEYCELQTTIVGVNTELRVQPSAQTPNDELLRKEPTPKWSILEAAVHSSSFPASRAGGSGCAPRWRRSHGTFASCPSRWLASGPAGMSSIRHLGSTTSSCRSTGCSRKPTCG